ncbi:MAG: hypothetical protein AMXMBFR72_37470 [Betaproteobacteria bacterium]|nr:MAG: RNA polymerase sigma factor [Betaproteobacteria bacterium]
MTELDAALDEMRPVLLRLARLQLRNEAWAEDVVSETILAAIEQAGNFQRRAKLRTWVVGILKHKIIDQLRRQTREVSIEGRIESGDIDGVEDLYDEQGGLAHPPRAWGEPESALASREFFAVLQACLESLPGNLARAFLMREWLEYETPEICGELGITRANCNVMLFRARMRLRECIEARWLGKSSPKRCG